MSAESAERLEELCDKLVTSNNRSEVIRRALSVLAYVIEQNENGENVVPEQIYKRPFG
jgi:hypothetical protein